MQAVRAGGGVGLFGQDGVMLDGPAEAVIQALERFAR